MKTHLIISLFLFSMVGFLCAEDKADVNALIKRLGEKNAMTKRRAAEALARLGPRAAPAIKPLIKLLADEYELLRKASIEALGRIGAPAIPDLIKQLKGKHKMAMPAAGQALSMIGKPAVGPLLKILKDKNAKKVLADRRSNKDYLIQTVRALSRIGPDAAAAVNDLIPLVPSLIGAEVSLALAGIGPAAKAALPALLKASKNRHLGHHHCIAEALGSIGSANPTPVVKALIDYSKSRDHRAVHAAARNLGRLGPAAKSSVPALARLVCFNESRDWRLNRHIRYQTLESIAAIGPGAIGVAGDIVDRLGSSDNTYIAKAINALRKIGPKAVPALEKGVLSKNERIRYNSVSALGGMGPQGLNGLKTALHDKRRTVQINALEQLGYIGAQAVPVLGNVLRDPDAQKRLGAVKSLSKIGAPAAEALIQAFSDKEGAIRAEAIARTGAMGKGAFPALTKAIQTGQNGGRSLGALKAVLLIGLDARPLIPVCKRQIDSTDKKVKLQAARTLLAVGERSEDVVRLAMRSFADPDPSVRVETCRALAVAGAHAAPELTARLSDGHWKVRATAAEALASIGKPAGGSAKSIADAMADDRIWYGGVKALSKMGKAAHAAVPRLVEALHKSKDMNVRIRAAQALGAIKPYAPDAIPALIKVFEDGDKRLGDLHYICKLALAQIGPPAVPKLIEALDSKSEHLRRHAPQALARIGPPARDAVPRLTSIIMNGSKDWRHWNSSASHALGKIGPAAAPAIPELMRQIKVTDKHVNGATGHARRAAALAIAGIGKPAVSRIPELQALMKKEKDRSVKGAMEKAIQLLDAAR